MGTLNPNDQFLVNDFSDNFKSKTVTQANLMADLQNDDLMLVNRAVNGVETSFKATGLDIKNSLVDPIVITSVTLSTQDPIVGQSITATVIFTGGKNPITTYQWRADAVAISGATAANYTPTSNDVGDSLDCVVVVSDDIGNTATDTSASTNAVKLAEAIDTPTLLTPPNGAGLSSTPVTPITDDITSVSTVTDNTTATTTLTATNWNPSANLLDGSISLQASSVNLADETEYGTVVFSNPITFSKFEVYGRIYTADNEFRFLDESGAVISSKTDIPKVGTQWNTFYDGSQITVKTYQQHVNDNINNIGWTSDDVYALRIDDNVVVCTNIQSSPTGGTGDYSYGFVRDTTTAIVSGTKDLDKIEPGVAKMTSSSGAVLNYTPVSSRITSVTLENTVKGSTITGVVDISAAFNDITEIRGLALQNLGNTSDGALISDMTVNGVSVRGGITAATVQGNSFLANRYNWSEPGTNGTPPGFWGQPYTGASGNNTAEAAQVGSTSVAGFQGFTYLSTLSSGDYITVPSGATVTIRGSFYGSDNNQLLVLDQNDNWITVVGAVANTVLTFSNNQDLTYFLKDDMVQGPSVSSTTIVNYSTTDREVQLFSNVSKARTYASADNEDITDSFYFAQAGTYIVKFYPEYAVTVDISGKYLNNPGQLSFTPGYTAITFEMSAPGFGNVKYNTGNAYSLNGNVNADFFTYYFNYVDYYVTLNGTELIGESNYSFNILDIRVISTDISNNKMIVTDGGHWAPASSASAILSAMNVYGYWADNGSSLPYESPDDINSTISSQSYFTSTDEPTGDVGIYLNTSDDYLEFNYTVPTAGDRILFRVRGAAGTNVSGWEVTITGDATNESYVGTGGKFEPTNSMYVTTTATSGTFRLTADDSGCIFNYWEDFATVTGETKVTGPANTGTGDIAAIDAASKSITINRSNKRWISSGTWNSTTKQGNAAGTIFYITGDQVTDAGPDGSNLDMTCTAFDGTGDPVYGNTTWQVTLDADTAFDNPVVNVTNQSETVYNVTTLNADTIYRAHVRQTSTQGTESQFSDVNRFKTKPDIADNEIATNAYAGNGTDTTAHIVLTVGNGNGFTPDDNVSLTTTYTPTTSLITTTTTTDGYNQDAVWSNFLTPQTGVFNSKYPATNAFDGNVDRMASGPDGYAKFAPTTPITINQSFEFIITGNNFSYRMVCDGADQTLPFVAGTQYTSFSALVGKTISSDSPLYLYYLRQDGTTANAQFTTLKIDGKMLVDKGVANPTRETAITLTDATDLQYFQTGDEVQEFDSPVYVGNAPFNSAKVSNAPIAIEANDPYTVYPGTQPWLTADNTPAGTVLTYVSNDNFYVVGFNDPNDASGTLVYSGFDPYSPTFSTYTYIQIYAGGDGYMVFTSNKDIGGTAVTVISTDIANNKITVNGGNWYVPGYVRDWVAATTTTGNNGVFIPSPPSNIYDNDLTTSCHCNGDGGACVFTVLFNPSIAATSGVTFWGALNASDLAGVSGTMSINDGATIPVAVMGGDVTAQENFYAFVGNVEKLVITKTSSNDAGGLYAFGIAVDGNMLINTTETADAGDSTVSTISPKRGAGTVKNVNGNELTITPWTDNAFVVGKELEVDGQVFYSENRNTSITTSELRRIYGLLPVVDKARGICALTEQPNYPVLNYTKTGDLYRPNRNFEPEVNRLREILLAAACRFKENHVFVAGEIIYTGGIFYQALTTHTTPALFDATDGNWEVVPIDEDPNTLY